MKMHYINNKFNYKKNLRIKKVKEFLKITTITIIMSISSSSSAKENDKNTSLNSTTFNSVLEFEKNFLELNKKEDTIIINDNTLNTKETDNQVEEIVEDNRIPVALTFDDGPGKYTDRLLDILEENGIKVTFFVTGTGVEAFGEATKRAYDDGHEIGIHGYSHTSFKKMSIEDIQSEIDTVYGLLTELDIVPTDLVRPPYGSINNEIKENLDYSFILWNVDTLDWKTRDKDAIIEEIYNSIENGSIILMHDIHETTVDAVEEILPELIDTYRFVTVSELFSLNEQELEKHKSYRKVKVLEKVEE